MGRAAVPVEMGSRALTDCLIYVRFSHPSQEQGSSRERQLELCQGFVEQKGWNLLEPPIGDYGRSAWKADHLRKGNLGKLRKRVDDRDLPRGAIIVVEEIDRLSRQKARTTMRWIEDVCDAGYKIATAATGKVYDADNLDQNILSLMEILLKAEAAWEYSERLSRRSKASYQSRLKRARIDNTAVSGIGPAWLQKVGERPNITWSPIPERVKLIHEMFDLTVAGQAPWTIARMFNERGEKSFTGKEWERTSIVKIIRNRAIEGDYVVGEGKSQRPTGEVLHGYYGRPIVPLDVVKQARDMLDRRRRGSGRNSGAVNNLFGQSIRCGECGGRMMQVGYQSRYLVCYEANRGNGCAHRTSYKYRPFEAAALDNILHLALDERFFRQAQKSNMLGLEIATTEKAIRDAQADAEFAYDMARQYRAPTAERRYQEAEARVAELQTNLERLNEEMTLAQGAASAEAHLERVVAVRDALSHPQDDVRLPARLRISEALQNLVDKVECGANGWGEKRLVLHLVGGIHRVAFDNEGHALWQILPNSGATAEEMLVGMDAPENRKRMEAYFKRRDAA